MIHGSTDTIQAMSAHMTRVRSEMNFFELRLVGFDEIAPNSLGVISGKVVVTYD